MSMGKYQIFSSVLYTPGKLSQVLPAEVHLIGCDRHDCRNLVNKGWVFVFFGKIHNNQGVFLKIKECYSTLIYIKF